MSQPTSLVKRYVKSLVSTITLSSNEVVITDASSLLTTNGLASSKLPYLANISSDVQSQINTKFSSNGGVINGAVGIGTVPLYALHVAGDMFASGTIYGSNLSILGDTVVLNTTTSNTEQLAVVNDGTCPALDVVQKGPFAIARFFDDENLAVIIADGGNVGINTSSPYNQLDVVGTASISANLGVGTSTPQYTLHVNGSAFANELNTTILYTTTSSETSDERQKTNVHTIVNPLSIIDSLRGVTFNWLEDNHPDIGLIAQEVESVLPVLIRERENGMKSISYSHMAGLFVEAIKEQQKTIDAMKNEISDLRHLLITMSSL